MSNTELSIEEQNRRQPATAASGLFSFADRLDYLLMFFASVGSCAHGAALPLFLVLFGKLIDSLASLSLHPHKLASEISKQALQLVYLGLLVMASAWIGVAFWMHTGERQTARLRVKYIQSVLQQDMTFFDTEAREENILYRISSDAILVQDAIGDKIGHCQRYLSQSFVGLVMGFSTVWQLTLLALAVLPLIVVAGGTYAIIMSSLSKKGEKAYAEAGKVAEEVISQIRTVYSYVAEGRATEEYSKSLETALKLGKKSGLAKGLGVGCTFGLLFCSWALLLWFAGILVIHRVTTGGKAFTTILNVIYSGFALGQAAPSLSSFAKGRAAASNIINMIENVPNVTKESDKGVVLPEVVGNIAFSEVSFSYPSRKHMIFEDLSLVISAGKTFAFVGESGSGKSTIISMIERFYEPTLGKILLDGHDIKDLQLKWLRNQMGLVSQEPALFSTTIASNILHGNEGAQMEEIVEAAKVANAHSFIQNLPGGYMTEVGERGTQLSGGQKQRIAIARAVLRNPKILLLDEATSALDAESEHHIQRAFERVMLNRTTIIVAHRLSTISNVDTIAVLKHGKIIESGTHVELISKGDDGEYAKMVNLQTSANSEKRSQNNLRQLMDSYELSAGFDQQETEVYYEKAESMAPGNQKSQEHGQRKLASTSPIWRAIRLNKPEWPFGFLGSVGAILAGMQAPLCALGITHVLTAFYSHNKHETKHEIKMISLIFIGAAIITVPIYTLQHYFYTLMGEKLTTRVRLLMFSAILKNEVGWFDLDEHSSGSLASTLAADATLVKSTVADRMSSIIQNISLTVTAFVIAFLLSWRLAAVVIATFPPHCFIYS
ncbi:ABC transporter B family member 13-like [Asparagus officinalis]|uniref:ABC transporter B family member 13-like n=1 Tax=Asparagus officinalis TaxID=4686 RepID=UPI00098E27E7|nr:ABC transporter B family member 13-like [Asparagus officinalis]